MKQLKIEINHTSTGRLEAMFMLLFTDKVKAKSDAALDLYLLLSVIFNVSRTYCTILPLLCTILEEIGTEKTCHTFHVTDFIKILWTLKSRDFCQSYKG